MVTEYKTNEFVFNLVYGCFTAFNKMLSIPDLATQLLDKTLPYAKDANSNTIFLVGSKTVGKSTLLQTFLDKSDNLRETLVLEYSFGRKSVQKHNIEKNICHVWEYGGNHDMLKSVFGSVPKQGKLKFCIMVDLSRVKAIWNTLESCLLDFHDVFSTSQNIPEIILIGGKYDIFKSFDSDTRKLVSTTIRSIGLLYKCNVFFYTSKDPVLVKRAKEIFHCLGFGEEFPAKDRIININKPLFIPKDMDSWESIGTPSATMEQIKSRHLSLVPLDSDISSTNTTDVWDVSHTATATVYAEPILDSIIARKYDELRHIEVSMRDYP